MYSQTQDNGFSSYLPFDHLSQFTELEIETETSNLLGCGNYYSNYSSGSGCSSSYVGSPSSNSMGPATNHPPTTACPGAVDSHLFQRSISSLSSHKGGSYSLLGLTEDSLDDGPVRRVYSTGDLESSYMARRSRQRAESPLSVSNENTLIIEGIMKATKYSPEEKRERIERYRNKRNQRNFHKKIQYACRKSLADSRPRIKGRFVRNDEISTIGTTMTTMDGNNNIYDGNYYLANDQFSSSQHMKMMNEGDEEDEYEENSWINLLNYSFPSQYEH